MTPAGSSIFGDAAVVEAVPRAVFSVTGERPLGYLHDVLAQDVAELEPGRGAIAAVLTAGGRVAAEVRVLAGEAEVLLDCEEAARDGVAEHVARHAPLAGCEVADVSARLVVAAVRGPGTDRALAAVGIAAPDEAEASFRKSGGVRVVRVGWGLPGIDLIGSSEDVAAALAAFVLPRASAADLEAALIEAGRPRYGVDVTEELLVNETPLLRRGVSTAKGCYPGQESVARILNLGRVRRSLRGLRSAGAVAAGDAVSIDDAVVGIVTSATASGNGGGWRAIALLREDAAPGATVRAGESDAVVVELP